MCGICGIVRPAGGKPSDPSALLAMMDSLRHRGPDSSGYYRDTSAALGHTRLAIIDLASGAQPLSNEDESIWITFNGEIFNYLELTDELVSRGHIFRTKSDTEVIVHAWEEWGTGCFEKFNGQWALAIWDARHRRLVVSRDRLGIRPLYYTFMGDLFIFASEIKALFAYPGVHRELDPEGIAETFTFWGPVPPRTAFTGIRELAAGHFGLLTGATLRVERYWDVPFPAAGDELRLPIDEAASELRSRLIEATKLRFTRSDVPVAAYLSGGIDSSVTSAIISRFTPSRLKTFSLRFADREFDEGTHQDEMVRRLGTDHESISISCRDIGNIFPEAIMHAERPVLRTAPAPMFLLSRLVRERGYKVVVTGEGADEVLAGYDIFKELLARLFIARDPASMKRKQIVYSLYPWMARSPNRTPAFAQAFFTQGDDTGDPAFSHRLRWNTSSALTLLLDGSMIDRMSGPDPASRLLESLPEGFDRWAPLSRAQWLELHTLLAGYILSAQGDRMLMGNSVEGRFPFLDVNLVEFAVRLPPSYRIFGFEEKYILKRAFADLVPESILNRPKQPYRAPDAESFFPEGKPVDWVDDLLSPANLADSRIFKPDAVQRLAAKCRKQNGRRMSNTDNMRIVAVLSTLLLHHRFVSRSPGSSRIGEPAADMRIVDRVASRYSEGAVVG